MAYLFCHNVVMVSTKVLKNTTREKKQRQVKKF